MEAEEKEKSINLEKILAAVLNASVHDIVKVL